MVENEVSIFDSLYGWLCLIIELLKNVVHGLRMLPQLIADGFTLIQRYENIFPAFIWFLVLFAFGYGIIQKVTHWGG